jgi:uncharacterized protein (DUF4415 family)
MPKRANSRPDGTNPEWTAEDFRNARPLTEVLPKEMVAALRRMRGQRGPQKSPTKELISLRLDREVLEALRATGLGWQTRVNDTLRAAYVTNSASETRATTRAAATRGATGERRRAVAKRRSSTAKRRA